MNLCFPRKIALPSALLYSTEQYSYVFRQQPFEKLCFTIKTLIVKELQILCSSVMQNQSTILSHREKKYY